MSIWLLACVTTIYLAVAVSYAWQNHRYGMALVFVAYALANCGLIWDAVKGGQ